MRDCKFCNKIDVQVMDENENIIPSKRIDFCSYDSRLIKIKIKDDSSLLSDDEWDLLSLILYDEIADGGQVDLMRKYLELYDKIEKIVERKYNK